MISNDKIYVYGLLIGCPLKSSDDKCILCKFRKLDLEDAIEKISDMSDSEVSDIIESHKSCSTEKSKNHRNKI